MGPKLTRSRGRHHGSGSDIGERLERAATRWDLTIGDELIGGTSSAVFAAHDSAGRDLVLKLPSRRAGGGDAAAAEAAALVSWAHTGAVVQLIDATADALLLVRARPGDLRPWGPPTPIDDTVALAGELLRRLWSAAPGAYRHRTLAQAYPEDERDARADAAFEQRQRCEPDRGEPGLRRLPAAAAAAEELMACADSAVLLHGDFISKNLVSDTGSPVGWVALDPLPMMGDPAAEVAAFAAYHPAELIFTIAESLARDLALDPRRVLRWTPVWTVHQAAQAWRDDQVAVEALVASAAVDRLLGSRR